jgi:hypothetical protein
MTTFSFDPNFVPQAMGTSWQSNTLPQRTMNQRY